MKHILTAAAFALAAIAPAHAALTSTGIACDGQGTGMTSDAGFLACSGSWSGNNLNQSGDVLSQIQSNWGLTGLTTTSLSGSGSSSGSLSFAAQSGLFVIALKAGNAFSLYEFDGSKVAGGISSLSFDTLGVGFFSGKGGKVAHYGQALSHADLYSMPTPVPEPESYALLLAGLGVIGLLSRRRSM